MSSSDDCIDDEDDLSEEAATAMLTSLLSSSMLAVVWICGNCSNGTLVELNSMISTQVEGRMNDEQTASTEELTA